MEEIWLNYPPVPTYQISSLGRVRGPQGRILKQRHPNKVSPYLVVNISSGSRSSHTRHFVHRLVIETFVSKQPFNAAQVRHLDGNPTNNIIENLQWGTVVENAADRECHGTALDQRGEQNTAAKLTWGSVCEIRRRVAGGERQKDLATEYGVSPATICLIVAEKTWQENCF